MNKINNVLKRGSNITPIRKMGTPARSKYSVAAERIYVPEDNVGYVKGGDIAAGLAAGLKGYLGMRGALQDAYAQQAYNDNQAQWAEQDRLDKLAQQAAEMGYRERELAQKRELEQMKLEAEKARADLARQQALADRDAQWAHEASVYDRNRADAVADRDAQLQAAVEAENRKRAYEEEQALLKQLDPASQQKYYDMKAKGQNPKIVDNKVGTFGKFFGTPKYGVSDGTQKQQEAPQMPKFFGFNDIMNYKKYLQDLAKVEEAKKQDAVSNRAAFDAAWGK